MTRNIHGNAPELARLIPDQASFSRQEFWGFSSPEALVNYVESSDGFRAAWQPAAWDDNIHDRGPMMLDTFKLCRDGWQEGADRVVKLRERIHATRPTGSKLAKWDVAGAFPNVARAVSGNPLNMRRIDTATLRKRPIVNLIVNIGGLGDVARNAFTNRAAVVAAIVDEIEAAGYSCAVLALSQARDADKRFLCGVVTSVKEPGETVDVARLAFACGHVGMFRRLVFAVRGLNAVNRPLTNCLGWTTELTGHEDDTYVLPSINTCEEKFATEEKAATIGMQWAIDQLQSQGCPAFPKAE